MKTFKEFQEAIALAPLAIPTSKLIGAGLAATGLTGMVLQSRKKKDNPIPRDDQGMPDPLEKVSKRKKLKRAVKDIIKDVKSGLSVNPKDVTAKKYNPNAEFVRKEMEKRAKDGDSYAKRFIENMKRNRNMPEPPNKK